MTVDWSEVYAATYTDLVRFLYRKVWDADRAEDLAQETFVRALGQEPDAPRAWLFTVAANLARDEARRLARGKKHLTLIRNESDAATSEDPVERLDQGRKLRRVRIALKRLSDRDRQVLLLWDAGLSYTEIATQTGLARGAIGTTLARARRRLVETLEALEEERAARG